MSLPESQLQLDDLFIDMLDRLSELVEFSPEKTDEQLTHAMREFVFEFMARVLLLAGAKS